MDVNETVDTESDQAEVSLEEVLKVKIKQMIIQMTQILQTPNKLT